MSTFISQSPILWIKQTPVCVIICTWKKGLYIHRKSRCRLRLSVFDTMWSFNFIYMMTLLVFFNLLLFISISLTHDFLNCWFEFVLLIFVLFMLYGQLQILLALHVDILRDINGQLPLLSKL